LTGEGIRIVSEWQAFFDLDDADPGTELTEGFGETPMVGSIPLGG
jgi:hypothetical protein